MSAQKKLVDALEETKSLVRFASPQSCKILFDKIATFSSEMMLEKKIGSNSASDQVVSECSCLFTGVCDQSARVDGVCRCCEGVASPKNESDVGSSALFEDEDNDVACALCLCSLQQELY